MMWTAASKVLSEPSKSLQALQYNDYAGAEPLRWQLAKFLTHFYGPPDAVSASRIFVTGGASTGLVNILMKFTDTRWTRRIFMAAPTYFLACPMLEDAGFKGKLEAVPEDDEGVDVHFLEQALAKSENSEVKVSLNMIYPL
jgi:DNA-binding transcriptional MocR family regulator